MCACDPSVRTPNCGSMACLTAIAKIAKEGAYEKGFRDGVLSALTALDEHEQDRARQWAVLRDELKKTAV